MTCGHDCDVRIMEGEDSTEFSVSSDKLSAIVCYRNQEREDVVAVAMDDYSVQAFKLNVRFMTLQNLLSYTYRIIDKFYTHLFNNSHL